MRLWISHHFIPTSQVLRSPTAPPAHLSPHLPSPVLPHSLTLSSRTDNPQMVLFKIVEKFISPKKIQQRFLLPLTLTNEGIKVMSWDLALVFKVSKIFMQCFQSNLELFFRLHDPFIYWEYQVASTVEYQHSTVYSFQSHWKWPHPFQSQLPSAVKGN